MVAHLALPLSLELAAQKFALAKFALAKFGLAESGLELRSIKSLELVVA